MPTTTTGSMSLRSVIHSSIVTFGIIAFASNSLFSIKLGSNLDDAVKAAAEAPQPTKEPTIRPVEFINARDDLFTKAEMYSGMWWQNKHEFLKGEFQRMQKSDNAAATFLAFEKHNQEDVLMTRDWLDLNVEHLSKYVKFMEWTIRFTGGERNALVEGIESIMTKYIENSQQSPAPKHLAVHYTICLLAFQSSPDPIKNQLLKLQLAATLASLWKAGMARAVVFGVSDIEKTTFQEIKTLLQDKLKIGQTMELVYTEQRNITKEESKLIPKLSLLNLKRVMQKVRYNPNDKEVKQWLGDDPERWRLVYFTEPDLLLHIRPSALPAITQQLEEGKLIAGHRLEPLPHSRDYDDAAIQKMTLDGTKYTVDSILLPDHGAFAALQRMDDMGDDDVCCDQGKYYPAHRKDPTTQEKTRQTCHNMWFLCGYANDNNPQGKDSTDWKNQTVLIEMHHRLLGYPFFALETGTGMPLVGSHQRVCVPSKGTNAHCSSGIVKASEEKSKSTTKVAPLQAISFGLAPQQERKSEAAVASQAQQ